MRDGGQWSRSSCGRTWGPGRAKLRFLPPGIQALDTNRDLVQMMGEYLSIDIVSHSGLVMDTRRGVGELPYIEMGMQVSERIGESIPF